MLTTLAFILPEAASFRLSHWFQAPSGIIISPVDKLPGSSPVKMPKSWTEIPNVIPKSLSQAPTYFPQYADLAYGGGRVFLGDIITGYVIWADEPKAAGCTGARTSASRGAISGNWRRGHRVGHREDCLHMTVGPTQAPSIPSVAEASGTRHKRLEEVTTPNAMDNGPKRARSQRRTNKHLVGGMCKRDLALHRIEVTQTKVKRCHSQLSLVRGRSGKPALVSARMGDFVAQRLREHKFEK